MTPAGLEPAIPGSVGRCLIHWATGPVGSYPVTSYHISFVTCLCMIGFEIIHICTHGFRGKVSDFYSEDSEDRMNHLAEQPMVDVDTQQLARCFEVKNIPSPGLAPGSLGWGPSIPTC